MTPRRLIEPARLAGTSMLRTQSDARLVDLVRAGHAAAFEAIVQRYRKQLLAYCSRLLPASRAEDAVQQTFLKAYQAMVSGDAELHLRPWLYRIAHNSSLNLLRQNGWSHEQLDENMDGVQRPDQALELRERLRSTVSAVKALPERQRDAVLLREIEGLSYEEIASALGIGDGAVRQLLHRARSTLRAGLTAVTPVGLVERLAATLAAGGEPSARVAETAAGIGLGAGATKLGAAVLATGVIATGAVTVPLHRSHHQATRTTADESSVRQSSGSGSSSSGQAPATLVEDHSGPGSSGSGRRGESHRGSDDKSGHRHHRSSGKGGKGDKDGEDHSGTRSGSGDNSPSGEHHRSGSGGGSGTEHSGSDDQSGGGGGTGHGGRDDAAALGGSEVEDHHGGGDDRPTITAPTTTVPAPIIEGESGKGKGSGGSGSGSGGGDG